MHPAPGQVCVAEGGDVSDHQDGVARIMEIPRSSSVPAAADAIRQQVMKFLYHRRPDQSIREYIVEFDLLRRAAESKMRMGAGLPEQFVSISCANNAGLIRQEKSLVLASCH